jgi:hypothetical protein
VHAHAIPTREGGEAERGRGPHPLVQHALRHRRRGVDEQPHRHVVLRFVEADQQPVEAGEGELVNATEVVTRLVGAEVGELQGRAAMG